MTDYPNRGAAWRNRNKQSEQQPDLKGSINCGGKDYWLNVWINPDAQGDTPPLKCAVQPKQPEPQPKPANERAGKPVHVGDALAGLKQANEGKAPMVPGADFDDEIPF